MGKRGRYAPSPTGKLHLGNLRTALLAWLQCRLAGAEFILRIDDIDLPRCRAGAIEQIIADLRWLGIDWDYGTIDHKVDITYQQSQRQHYYKKAFDRLLQQGRVYACCCSRKDIEQALSAPHQDQSGSIYPGTCRPLNMIDNKRNFQQKLLSWRFLVDDENIYFEDKILGQQQQNLCTVVGDFVVKRKDGLFSYQLASVVDDIEMNITDVVRGADLIDSSARQIALHYAFDKPPPRYWHVPLVKDINGRRMSKRGGAICVQQWQNQGKTAADLIGQFAFGLGFIDRLERLSCAELLQQLDDKFVDCLKC